MKEIDHYPERLLEKGEFPELLFEIPDSPTRLSLRGTLPPQEHKLLAVVGSRSFSSYGKQACETLISGLAGYPISIISGLALGIDGIAHKSALRVGLHTLSVPGSGLSDSVLYPRTHRALAHEILRAGGGLLSEYESNFQATPWSFPKRNRVMAGMSHAVLVVEAGERSGTLVTARLAMEYNREVLAVPGPIFQTGSYGPHMLIQNGATPITSSLDILRALGIEGAREPERSADTFSKDERVVLTLLSQEALPRDELIRALALPTHEAQVLLSTMELNDLISEERGVVYGKIKIIENPEL